MFSSLLISGIYKSTVKKKMGHLVSPVHLEESLNSPGLQKSEIFPFFFTLVLQLEK